MSTEIAVWEIVDGKLRIVGDDPFAAHHPEMHLEKWVAAEPSLLGEDLLVIGEQVDAEGAGRIDLLCIGESGSLTVVEFKRERTTRETIAQALDYASWLRLTAADTIRTIAEAHLKRPLADAFDEHFGTPLNSLNPQLHKIIVAAPTLDSSAERIITYLAEQHGVPINAVFFRYARTAAGEIFARSVLVPEAPPAARAQQPTQASILALAEKRGVAAIVQVCRELVSIAQPGGEEFSNTYGGSLRYWLGGRMIVGINVSGQRRNAPQGQIDVWVQAMRFADAAGLSEPELRSALKAKFRAEDAGATNCIVRLNSVESARVFASQVVSWIKGTARAAPAQ